MLTQPSSTTCGVTTAASFVNITTSTVTSSLVASTSTVSSTTDNPTVTPKVENNGLVPAEPGSVKGKRKKAKTGNTGSELVTPKKAKLQVEKEKVVILEPESGEIRISSSSATQNTATQPKRSRKQQIKTLQEVFEDVTTPSPKRPTKRKGTTKKREVKASSLVSAKPVKPSTKKSKGKANVKGVSSATTTPVPNSKQKIILNRSFKVDPNLSFTIVPDTTRNISAIGPLQCVVAAESNYEPGKTADLENCVDVKKVLGTISGLKKNLFSNYLSAPHFVPLTDLWNSGQSLTRIVKFSSLEQYTGGKQLDNVVNVYRFSGLIYEKQLKDSDPPYQGFPARTLVIKHPVFEFYSRNFVQFSFLILKKINYNGHTIAIPKVKIVKLKRSSDLVNVELFVEEENFTGKISDVSEMNERNIQPVIHTPNAGLIPLLPTRTSQTVQLTPAQDQLQLHQPFQYVRYEYQTASELVPVEETSNSLVISGNNYQNQIQGILPQVNRHTAGIEEVGGQTQIILLPAADFLQPESHNQQHIIFQPQDSSYAVTEQVSLLQPAQQQPQVQYHIQPQQSTPHIQVQQLQQQTQSDGVYSELLLPGHTTPLRVRIQQRPEGHPLQIVRHPFSNSQQVVVQPAQQQYINTPQIIRVESQSQQQQFVPSRAPVTGIQFHAATSGQQSVIVRTPPPSQNHSIKLTQQQQVQLQQQLQQQHQIQQQHQSQQKQGEAPQQQVNQTFHPSQADQSQQIRNQQGFQAQTQVQGQVQGQPQPLQNQIRVEHQSQPQQAPPQIPQVYQSSRLQQPQVLSQYQTPTIESTQVQTHKTQVPLSQLPQASSQQPNFAGPRPPIQNNIGTLPGSSYPTQTTQSQFQQPTQPLPLEPAKQKPSRTKQPKGKKGAAVNTLQYTQTPLPSNPIPQQTQNNQAVSSSQTVNTFTTSTGPASLVRVATVSPCSTSENSGAPKSFSTLPFSRVPGNVISELGKRTVLIVNSSKTPKPSTSVSVTDRPTQKPGFVAVCPHCGLCNKSIINCNRCRIEFPEDVKLIKDVWSLNKSEAAVVAAPSTITTTASTIKSDSALEISSPVLDNKAGVLTVKKGGPTKTTKKIVLVKNTSLADSAVNNNNIKSVIKPGTATVQVHIQPDGGNSVTLLNSSVVPSAAQKKAVTAPKKRAPPRKKQQECITLSSDEEEPQPPKPKVYKLEESSKSTAASTTVAAVPSSPLQQTTQSLKSPASSTSQKTPTVGLNLNSVSNSVSHPNEDMGKKGFKQMKVNVSAEMDIKPAKPEPSTEPPAVLEQIEKLIAEPGGKFQYASVKARSVRVGTYKITTSDYQVHDIVVTLTELGITFSLPHACYRHKKIKICIPKESILQMRISNQNRLAVIFIDTGPKYAKWIRNALGMDGNAENQSTNYYCPLNGGPGQKNITILGDEPFPPADYGSIKAMYRTVLEEVNYQAANHILMQITPQSFKSIISYKSESSTTSSSESSPTGPMIVSTKSMAPESKNMTSAVAVKRDSTGAAVTTAQESSQDLVNSLVVSSQSASNSEQDPEGVVLFYEGRNNNKVSVSPQDIRCLGYSQFLNDQIIDFWLAVIQTEILSEEDQKRTFVFDSFFYSKLTEKIKKRTADEATMSAGERRHARVKKRTKNVDIFEKDFLIVPINENYHWFLAIICFAGLEGYHDYDTLTPLPDYKGAVKPKATKKSNAAKKTAIVYNQPQNQSTASFSNRDEAPADPEEDGDQSQDSNEEGPKTPNVNETESKNENHLAPASNPVDKVGVQTRTDSNRRVKHPCILIFDSLAGEARGRIFSTLREYLKVEYKTKKNRERLFDKFAIPGCMPKVPQQPNFSDCGLFMLQYVESFFTNPPESFETSVMTLKNWFPSSIAENKRKEIYNFIVKKTEEKSPQHVCRIPEVSFEPDPNDLTNEEHEMMRSIGTDDTFDEDESSSDEDYFEAIKVKKKRKSDDDKDHSYSVVSTTTTATTPRTTFIAVVKRE